MAGGKELALQALSGKATERIPVLLFSWDFDYIWKVAGIEPWQLALGSHETWHRAHLALYERHKPDILLYSGTGAGDREPTLLYENAERWVARDNNTGVEYGMLKSSFTRYKMGTGEATCIPNSEVRSYEDVDRLTAGQTWGDDKHYEWLSRLIRDVGDRALVMPHPFSAYIDAIYFMGFERAMEAMIENPELFAYACEKLRARDGATMRRYADAGVEGVFCTEGWSSCDIISPAMFERFALPCQRSLVEAAHGADMGIILWNPGDVLPILGQEALLEMDAFSYEQPRKGASITVGKVRQAFGANRCILGNLDSELLLVRNDPQEIRLAVEDQIAQSGEGSPFIFSTGSPIPSDVEISAVDAMIDAVRSRRGDGDACCEPDGPPGR